MLTRAEFAQTGQSPDDIDIAMIAAFKVALQSKDPSSQTGAVILGQTGDIIGVGFNGTPRGVDDTEARRTDRETKLRFYEHAERRAIAQAARLGQATYRACLVSPWVGCTECDRMIIESGIRHVVRFPVVYGDDHWGESIRFGDELMQEAGVAIYEDTFDHLSLPSLRRGGKSWVPGEQ